MVSFFGLLISAPILLPIIFLVWIQDFKSPFYIAPRVGINEKEFNSVEVFPSEAKFIVTIGERGTLYGGQTYPTEAVEVFDVCGAGDVFLSTLVSTYIQNKDISESIKAANTMASLSVTHMGTYVLTKQDIEHIGCET